MSEAPAIGDGEPPIFNIRGEKVALGPLSRNLFPLIATWLNHFETRLLSMDDLAPRSMEQIAAEWESALRGERPRWVGFAIYELATTRPIGLANLRDFGDQHQTAEFGIMIGDPADRGKGYGTEATMLLLDYAFTALGVHNVWLDTAAFNQRAIRAYEKAGFRVIGRRREAFRLAGRAYDVVLMDCLATEFRSPLKRVIEVP